MKKLVTVIVHALVYVLFHLSTWIYYVKCYSAMLCYSYTLCQQPKKLTLKNGKKFHTVNKRLTPIRRLPRLNAGSIRLSFK